MQKPLTIAFRHIAASEAIEELIRKRANRLERICKDIEHCIVRVEAAKNHAVRGFPFAVRIELHVPGKSIVVTSASEMHHANVDAYAAIRRSFDSVERRLEDYSRIQRHHFGQHEFRAGSATGYRAGREN